MSRVLVVIGLVCGGAWGAQAATITWANPASGNWSVAGNWSPAQVPGSGDTAIITNGTTSYSVTLDVAATVGGLVVGNGSGGNTQTFIVGGQLLTLDGPSLVAATGLLDIGSAGLVIAGPLTNNGTVNWESGAVQMNNNGTANNLGAIWNAGHWNITCSQTMYPQAVPADDYFHNSGTLTMDEANGSMNIGPYLDNAGGTVVAQAGAINFSGSSNLGGSFQAAAGAAINFSSGTINWDGAANFSGNVQITGGTVNVTANVTSLAASFATITGLSNIVSGAYLTNCTIVDAERIVGTVNWADGTLNNAGSLTVANSGVLNIISGNGNYWVLAGPLTNNGTVNWSGCGVEINNDNNISQSGGIWNLGIWNMKGTVPLSANNGSGYNGYQVFHNWGILTADAAADSLNCQTYLDNTGGTVQAAGGMFAFSAGSNMKGSFQATSGGAIDFTAGILNWDGTANFSGNVQITGGTVNVIASVTSLAATSVTITGLSNIVSGAYLTNCTIADAERIVGTVNWGNGTINNSGSLTVGPTGVLNIIYGDGNGFVIAGPLTNNGVANWVGGSIGIDNNNNVSYSGGIWNQGTWNIPAVMTLSADNGSGYSGHEVFQNTGRLVITSPGTVTFQPRLENAGTVDVETGSLALNAGATLETNGILEFGLNSLTSFGSISLSGAATLAGTLTAHLNGSYVPVAVGNTFRVVMYGAQSGSFAITNLPAVAIWQPTYGATALNLTVVKLVPQMTWTKPANIVYGTALGSSQLDATFASPVVGGTNISGTFTYTPAAGTVLDAGSNQAVSVKFTPKDVTDFTNVTRSVTVTVTKAPLTLTANSTPKTYGQTVTFADTEFGTSGLVNGDTVTSAILASSGSAPTAPVSGSPYPITITNAVGDAGLTNYTITYVNGSLTVSRAALTITASPEGKTYGQTVTFGSGSTLFTPSGLQNGETIGSVTLAVSGNGGAGTASVADSPYTITPTAAAGGTFAAGNYAISYDTGTLTVNPAPLAVTATGPAKNYGTALTAGTSTANFTTAGLQNGETVTSVILTPGANGLSATAAAGSSYTVTPSAATGAAGFATGNYTINYKNYNGTIGQAPLTITGNAQSKTYGQTMTFGSGSTLFTSTGLKNTDAISTVTITDTDDGGAAAATVGGTYDLTPSAPVFSTGTAANYAITFAPGLLTVNKATPTVTVTVGTYTYTGQAQGPNSVTTSTTDAGAVTWSYAGTGGTTYAASATPPTAAGSYTATASVAADANNKNSASSATAFMIGQAALTVTATGPAMTYGTALTTGPGTNFIATGLQNGETVTSVTLTPSAAGLSATTAAGAGYAVTPSAATGANGFATANYALTYTAYTGTVAKAPLTVTASAQSKAYGLTLTFGSGSAKFTSSGLKNADAISTVTISDTDAGGVASAVVNGTYHLTPSAAVFSTGTAANYAIAYNAGLLTVNPLALTLTGSRAYDGTTNAAAGILAISDLVAGDAGNVTLSGSAGLASAGVGSRAITSFDGLTLTGIASENYTLAGASGSVSITKATPTVVPTVGTYTYDGLAQGPKNLTISTPDTGVVTYGYAGVSGTTYGPSATLPKAAGSYTVTAVVAADANNNATASSATAFSISQAPLTITADNTNKYTGETLTLPGTAFTAAGLQHSETIGTVTLTSAGAAGTAAVGGYTIVPSAPTGGTFSLGNYSPSYVNGTLTVLGSPALTLTTAGTGSQLMLTFPTLLGQTYQVQTSTNLAGGNWSSVGGSLVGTGGTVSVTNSIAAPISFFQLQITP